MRPPDYVIDPTGSDPQTLRWHIFMWRGWQFALHKWLRSDEDRALHDHSADNISFILSPQGYDEIVRERPECPDVIKRRFPFVPYFRKAEKPHRVVLRDDRPVWSLWLRWPKRREWGFHCPNGWRHWKIFCNPKNTGVVGRGCD